jgi:putative DeoR family transcriptional regulator (stage III sporulation protein D)
MTCILFIKGFVSKGGRQVKDYIEERAMEIAEYIINEKATVRQTAKVFGVSKSTVHKDVTERLPKINPLVASQVKIILDRNKAERHIRGGRATKMKYTNIRHG